MHSVDDLKAALILTKPLSHFSVKPSKKKSAATKTKDLSDHGSLIDLDNNSSKSKSKDDGWNNNWEDDAWESLNN